MADQIQIPNRQPIPFSNPPMPTDLVTNYLSRLSPAQYAVHGVGNALGSAADAYLKNKQLQASAFGEGGPYLMNLLYGKGGQAPPPNPPMPQTGGGNPPPQMGDSNQNSPPPTAPPMGQQASQGQGGVGGPSPTNGMASPQASAQTMPSQSQGGQAPQPPAHPVTGFSQTIHDAHTHGGPEPTQYLGAQNQNEYQQKINGLKGNLSQSQAMYGGSTYGQKDQMNIMNQLKMAEASNASNQFQQGQAAEQNRFNTGQANENSRFQAGQALNRGKSQSEVAKSTGDTMTTIKSLQSTLDQIQAIHNDPNNKSIPFAGNLGAKYAGMNPNTNSKWAQNQFNAQGVTEVGAGIIEKLAEGRYNDAQAKRIADSFFPTGNQLGTKQGTQKIQRFQNYINQMKSGKIQEANAQLDAIAGSGFNPSNLGQPNQFPTSPSQIPQGRITVVSPSGQVGHIPQSQLKQALDQGYKQQ